MKWHTLAGQMAAELEKYMGSPYTINVVEEMARNKTMTMIHEKREEERKRLFEETAQVRRCGVTRELTAVVPSYLLKLLCSLLCSFAVAVRGFRSAFLSWSSWS